jgi:hypothetical protein
LWRVKPIEERSARLDFLLDLLASARHFPTHWRKVARCWPCVDILCRVDSWLKKSIRYQPLERLSFICLQIIGGPLPVPATHEITEDGEFFVADGEGFCHFTASLRKSVQRISLGPRSRGPLRPARWRARRQDTLTTAAAATQPFDEGCNGGGGSYRQARQRFSCQHADVTATQALNSHTLPGTHAKHHHW